MATYRVVNVLVEELADADTISTKTEVSNASGDTLLGRESAGAGAHEERPRANVIGVQNINAQTGTTYTLALSDLSKLVTLSNASAITLTVPPNSSEAFPPGSVVDLAQIGAGQVTVAAGAGVTVNATPGLKLRAQYAGASLRKVGTDSWILFGDLSA